ncbi:MAG: tetratricopeptide repeat protein [Thermodesulforhabdaceae bacterium]
MVQEKTNNVVYLAQAYQEQEDLEKEEDFLERFVEEDLSISHLQREYRKLLNEIEILRSENRWEQILILCHPVEEKWPHLAEANLVYHIQGEVLFALCQLKRFAEALDVGLARVSADENNFMAHSQLAFVAYSALLADKNREIVLTPKERKKFRELTHLYFTKSQHLRPDGVTCFYRHGMLYKNFGGKLEKAIPLFQRAVENWEQYDEEKRKARHQERKNYVKSLYQLAVCHLDMEKPDQAFNWIQKCIEEDSSTGYMSSVHKYYSLGKAHYAMKNYEEASKALERALVEAHPESNDYVFELLARSYLAQSLPVKAQEVLAKIPQSRRRPYILWTEAEIAVALKQLDKAKQTLLKASEIDRKGAHKALIRLAKLEIRVGNLSKALESVEKANMFFQKTYGNPYHEALFWQTAILIKMGRKSEAEKTLQDLYSFNPYYPHLNRLRKELAKISRT